MKMTVTITPTWTKTGEFDAKWYLVPIEFPGTNPMAVIYKAGGGIAGISRCFDWFIDPIDGSNTIYGTAPTLNAAKQAVRRAMRKAGMI